MALYQKSVVNKYLSNIDDTIVKEKYQAFKDHYSNSERIQNIIQSKEEQYQEGFLRDIFVNILGYTINPDPNYNLTTEYKNLDDAKKADGAILKDGTAIGVIELKSTKTKNLDDVKTQAFNYKNHQPGCKYVITSNFERLWFYIEDATEHEEFNLFEMTEERFRLFYLYLCRENILSDIPLKIKQDSKLHEENISKKLYKDYSEFKKKIFNNLVKNNPEHDKLLLLKKSQKILDRLLFIFFAEDKGLIPPNIISRIVEDYNQLKELDAYQPLFNIFIKFFNYIDVGYKSPRVNFNGYNGELFKPDEILERLIIDDEILLKDTVNLSSYDFDTDVDVNILGHIFEHSLNEIEELQAEIKGEDFKSQTSKRKKDGVYYTPKYITKYIVDNTVGKLCAEKKEELGIIDEEYERDRKGRRRETLVKLDDKLKEYREWLLGVTICDPACGSGAFLNQALEFLIEEHHYIDKLRSSMLNEGIVFTEIENNILENNLYGVDINEEAVEIAKLSLWLRTAKKGRKLSALNTKIKCGNSLIDDPEVAGEKAFKWEKEFPDVFVKKNMKAWHITTATHNSRYSERMRDYKVATGEAEWIDEEDEIIITKAISKIVKEDGLTVIEYNICGDHLHLLLVCEAEETSKIVGKIKSVSSRARNIDRGYTIPKSRSERRGEETGKRASGTEAERRGEETGTSKSSTSSTTTSSSSFSSSFSSLSNSRQGGMPPCLSENPLPSENPLSGSPLSENPLPSENPLSGSPLSEGSLPAGSTSENPLSENPLSENPLSENPLSENPLPESSLSSENLPAGSSPSYSPLSAPGSSSLSSSRSEASEGTKATARGVTQTKLWTQKYGKNEISGEEHLYNTIKYIRDNRIKHNMPENREIDKIKKEFLTLPENAFRPQYKGGFDVVIGNPPYVRVQNLNYSEIDYYKTNYSVAHKRIDISLLFFEKGIKELKENGLLSYITTIQFLNAEYGRKIRGFLLTKRIIEFIDYNGLAVFEGATTYPGVILIENSKAKQFNYRLLSKVGAEQLYSSKPTLMDPSELSDDVWVFSNTKKRDILAKIQSNCIRLKEIANPCTGLTSGLDSVFILTEQDYIDNNIEKGITLPVVRGRNLKRGYVSDNLDYVIYPYELIENETRLISEDQFRIKFPNAYSYLLKYKESLEKRKDSRKNLSNSSDWYKLIRKGKLDLFRSMKILTPGISKENRFAIDKKGMTYLCGGAGVFGLVQNKIDSNYLLALLNSKVVEFFMHSISTKKQGGYYSYLNKFLEKIPLPKNIDTKITKLSEQYQDLQSKYISKIEILTIFLMSSFTNIKLSEKLKNWDKLEFSDFIKELNKSVKKSSGNKLSKLDEMEWMEIFKTKKKEAMAIKEIIDRTDKEIDQMVYELYGLTEEEIKIVEGEE